MTNTSKLSPAPWTAKQWQGDEYKYNWEVRDYTGRAVVSIATESDAKDIAALPEFVAACVLLAEWADWPGDAPEMLDDAVEAAKNALRGMMG
jgi:hypothetical protein